MAGTISSRSETSSPIWWSPQPQKRPVRRLRRRRRQLGGHRHAHRELQDQPHKSTRLADRNPQQARKRSPRKQRRQSHALDRRGLRTALTFRPRSRISRRTTSFRCGASHHSSVDLAIRRRARMFGASSYISTRRGAAPRLSRCLIGIALCSP